MKCYILIAALILTILVMAIEKADFNESKRTAAYVAALISSLFWPIFLTVSFIRYEFRK